MSHLKLVVSDGESLEPKYASSIWDKTKPFIKYNEFKNNQAWQDAIQRAKRLWCDASGEVFKAEGDSGSCIVCDGIKLAVIMPRKRKPEYLMIIPSREVAWCQGSLHYERTKDIAIRELERAGLPVCYDFGRMD